MKGRKLGLSEVMDKLKRCEKIINDSNEVYSINDSNSHYITNLTVGSFLSMSWYEYIEPEKPKSLSERFIEDCTLDKLVICQSGGVSKYSVLDWLKQQEGEK